MGHAVNRIQKVNEMSPSGPVIRRETRLQTHIDQNVVTSSPPPHPTSQTAPFLSTSNVIATARDEVSESDRNRCVLETLPPAPPRPCLAATAPGPATLMRTQV